MLILPTCMKKLLAHTYPAPRASLLVEPYSHLAQLPHLVNLVPHVNWAPCVHLLDGLHPQKSYDQIWAPAPRGSLWTSSGSTRGKGGDYAGWSGREDMDG